ncbi:MAG TPA: hypothetical protein DGU02_09810 [Alphaproteobacteria bacterium]|nr:hypothetical protein [Alphaproteobacteria bacterium]
MPAGCRAIHLAHRYWPANNPAFATGLPTGAAGAFADLWNQSPDERVGQPGERPMTVTRYIAARRRFFQFEIGGWKVRLGPFGMKL